MKNELYLIHYPFCLSVSFGIASEQIAGNVLVMPSFPRLYHLTCSHWFKVMQDPSLELPSWLGRFRADYLAHLVTMFISRFPGEMQKVWHGGTSLKWLALVQVSLVSFSDGLCFFSFCLSSSKQSFMLMQSTLDTSPFSRNLFISTRPHTIRFS